MYEFLMIAFLVVAIILIGFIMIQQGKGADMGASFGAGASNTVFGSSGSGNFLSRTTAVLAVVFFVLSLALGNLSTSTGEATDDFSDLSVPEQEEQLPPVENNEDDSSDVPPIN
ncbi:preprotein translocase subunit SecG [Idiomarina sp.]|uniref:preprotein translocase subunit SecG n=1 Tax=Idiomarina sp. TaxID=1874361 RepID=UPI001D4AFC97|nr:preprotein translocase subunit SecG [Idiomarina sp.]MCJ8315742.1 preprotein translocase subunit SecG [Idiomarina sp.]NQZ15657.1 preprotein translocase subunit SecG [Idiomarina sp.]